MRANDTRYTSKRTRRQMPATKQVAFNPATRRYEDVYPESELAGEQVITMYWCQSAGMYMTVPESE